MKTGRSLVDMAKHLEHVKNTAKDFIVPTSKLVMDTEGKLGFENGSTHKFDLNNWSAGQLASYTEVPKQYADRLRDENKTLYAENINHGLQRQSQIANHEKKSASRMLRTLDGHVRGFVSNKYRRLDSYDMLNEALPILMDNGFQVESSELTERRLYVKAVTPKVQAEIKKGDVVNFGLTISTSDVGAGAFNIETFVYRLVCLNGMIGNSLVHARHLGRAVGGEDVEELLSTKTLMLSDAAFYSKMKDILTASLNPENFEREVNKIRDAADQKITNFDLEKVVELSMVATRTSGEAVKKSILAALASGNEGAGLTKWGLANSFTRAAQADELDYDTATDLERAGGQIIELGQGAWKKIAEAI